MNTNHRLERLQAAYVLGQMTTEEYAQRWQYLQHLALNA